MLSNLGLSIICYRIKHSSQKTSNHKYLFGCYVTRMVLLNLSNIPTKFVKFIISLRLNDLSETYKKTALVCIDMLLPFLLYFMLHSGSGRLLRLSGFPHNVRGSVPRTVMYFLTVLLQTRDGPLLFPKESVSLTCSQGYCLINTEPPALRYFRIHRVIRVKCLTQEHNTNSLAPVGFELPILWLPVRASNHCATSAPIELHCDIQNTKQFVTGQLSSVLPNLDHFVVKLEKIEQCYINYYYFNMVQWSNNQVVFNFI